MKSLCVCFLWSLAATVYADESEEKLRKRSMLESANNTVGKYEHISKAVKNYPESLRFLDVQFYRCDASTKWNIEIE